MACMVVLQCPQGPSLLLSFSSVLLNKRLPFPGAPGGSSPRVNSLYRKQEYGSRSAALALALSSRALFHTSLART